MLGYNAFTNKINANKPLRELALVEASSSVFNPPATLLIKRKAIRTFPDGKRVVLYYSDKLKKYISIPYSGDENAGNVAVNEATKPKKKSKVVSKRNKKLKKKKKESKAEVLSNLSRLGLISTEKNTGMLKFADGSSARVDTTTAKAIKHVMNTVNDENKVKFERMINKSKEHFLRAAAFAHGVHVDDTGKKSKPKAKPKAK